MLFSFKNKYNPDLKSLKSYVENVHILLQSLEYKGKVAYVQKSLTNQ